MAKRLDPFTKKPYEPRTNPRHLAMRRVDLFAGNPARDLSWKQKLTISEHLQQTLSADAKHDCEVYIFAVPKLNPDLDAEIQRGIKARKKIGGALTVTTMRHPGGEYYSLEDMLTAIAEAYPAVQVEKQNDRMVKLTGKAADLLAVAELKEVGHCFTGAERSSSLSKLGKWMDQAERAR